MKLASIVFSTVAILTAFSTFAGDAVDNLMAGSLATSSYKKVACSIYGGAANSCDGCFYGGTLYQGQHVANLHNDFFNGSDATAIFSNTPGFVRTEYVQSGFSWTESPNMWILDSTLFSSSSETRGPYLALSPNQVAKSYIKSKPGTGLEFISGPPYGGSRDIPSFKLIFGTTYYTKQSNFTSARSQNACIFFQSNWCGDSVIDAKEECDLGEKNGGIGSACSASCRVIK